MYQQEHPYIGNITVRFKDDSFEALNIIQVLIVPGAGIVALVTDTNRMISWSTVSQVYLAGEIVEAA